LTYWNSRKSDVDDWLLQFDAVGARWIGEALLRQIDVIGPSEVARAFNMPAQAMVGQKLVFTFLSEDDPASSANRIGALLSQLYARPNVSDFVAALTAADTGSRVLVCEDALWTGIELRNLLTRLTGAGDLEASAQGKRITFRHAVVCDYGLHIVHHFIAFNKLDFVDLFLGEGQRFVRVLAPEVHEIEKRPEWSLPPVQFEDWLTTLVRPIAFRDVALWSGQQAEAQLLCTQIGRQLIDKYVLDTNKTWREEVRESFALGAGGFGSTTAFGHSVPKACLPLLWLEGPVTLGLVKLNWKPLFYDARRAISSWP
jgi:hypothetical protein